MGRAIVDSFLDSKNISKSKLTIIHPDSDKAKGLSEDYKCKRIEFSKVKLADNDILFIGLKPQKFLEISNQIATIVNSNTLIISIMAGLKTSLISKKLNLNSVVRLMPNLGVKVKKGVTGFYANQNVSNLEVDLVLSLLNKSGYVEQVKNESLLDAITAVSGSGPAFVAKFFNAYLEVSKSLGFSNESANNICFETFMGTLEYLKTTNLDPEKFIEKVKSKGGTTEAGLQELDDNFDTAVKNAVLSANNRAKEISETKN